MLRALCGRVVLAAVLAAGTGCSSFMRLPDGFLRLGDKDDFQAVTGDDARLWAREFYDPNTASLGFWAQALQHEFVHQRGYEVVAVGDIASKRRTAGVWIECATHVGGERVGYLIGLWVDGNFIRVVEFVAREDVFAARVDAVRQTFSTVRW
ncbi:MAG: hypothetical protein KF830_06535 [Planctomycetes bacterium]|nr:hypothetical protein [Planctomycetota bacterium]